MKKGLTILLLALLFASCATKREVEYRDREIIRTQHDTLIVDVHDSVYHTIYQKGDTIYNTKYVEKTRYKDRIVNMTDTCYLNIVKKTTTTKNVVPKWCYFSLLITILLLIFALYKLKLWLQSH